VNKENEMAIYVADPINKIPEQYKHITATELGKSSPGCYHGLVSFAKDQIPRPYTIRFYQNPTDSCLTYSVIRIKHYAGWRKRKDAPYIRRAIIDASQMSIAAAIKHVPT